MTTPGLVLLRGGTTAPSPVGLGPDDLLLYVRAGVTWYMGVDGVEHEFIGVTAATFTAHLSDTVDAHDASAVSFVPAVGIGAVNVQAAVEEAATDATTALSVHAAAADPHPGYLTPAEGNAAYDALGAASAAVATHAGSSDPHPGYLTPAEGNAAYDLAGMAATAQAAAIQRGNHTGTQVAATISDFAAAVAALVPAGVSAVLAGAQANSTVTPAVLTGHTFIIPPGKTLMLNCALAATAAATTTGIGYGIRVTQPAGANGNAQGSWNGQVEVSSAATATGMADGDVFNVAAGANTLGEVLGTATVAGNNAACLQAVIRNTATNVSTTVTVEFRSEVAASAVTAQIGTSAAGMIF